MQQGCHVFSGAVRGAHIRLSLAKGGALTVLNQDVDGHQLIQTSGPAKLALKALKMNDRAVLRFTKPGSYTFGTKPFELKGMPAVKTMGMDNALRIIVTVR